jgi:Na+/melibiose symporter-like transporter
VVLTSSEERLPLSRIVLYGLPTAGLACMLFILLLYFLKFSTDVLLIAPATMGLLFGLSRVWDAVLDPLVGYLSDRTRTRWGRRRPWLLASSLPIALLFLMMWNPPSWLGGPGLVVWVAFSLFAFFTSTAAFFIPHQALGAELSRHSHDRTRIFGTRQVYVGIGAAFAVGGIAFLTNTSDPRTAALWLAAPIGLVTAGLIVFATTRLREKPEYLGRGGVSPLAAYADVWRNHHARLLLTVFLISSMGGATLAGLAPFIVEYVLGDKTLLPVFFVCYFVPAYLLAPLWLPLSLRFGKKTMYLFALGVSAVGYGSFIFLDQGSSLLVCGLAAVLGIGGGCGQIMGPSLQTDVIDYDEYRTGQRKEGSYFAVWSFVFKSAGGIGLMLAGFALQLSGFEPNVEQSELTRRMIISVFALFPFGCFVTAALTLLRFGLTGPEYTRIRLELDARARCE